MNLSSEMELKLLDAGAGDIRLSGYPDCPGSLKHPHGSSIPLHPSR